MLEDLTALHQAEAARRESELRLRGIFETMGEGVLVQSATGAIVECNPAACAILGMKRERLLEHRSFAGDNACTRSDGQPVPAAELPDRQVLQHGQPVRDLILGVQQAGTGAVRWLLVNCMPLPVGPTFGLNHQKARIVTTFADITASVQASENLRETKEKYEHLVESLPLMLVQLDRDLRITFQNRLASRLTGYSAEELQVPGFLLSLVEAGDQASLLQAIQQAQRGQPASVEFHCRTRDGQTKVLLALLQPLVGTEAASCTCLVMDMTVQRRLERELQDAQRLELVGRLASGTVHDFNNLLTIMLGLADLVKLALPPGHAAQTDMDRLVEAGEQASHLAGQLLTFSSQRPRAEHGIDLNDVVRQTLKLLRGVMTTAIEVESILAHQPAMIRGEETQLKQVIMNLCLNARDAMPEGGRLLVRTDCRHGWVRLCVQDSGTGMEDAVRSRIFEPFYSTKERGTGLGLAVVKQLVTEMGGDIDVWSRPGEGTRFEIRFKSFQPAAVLAEQSA